MLVAFESQAGEQALNYLRNITLHNVLGPDATDGEIRHLEGARWLVGIILSRMTQAKEDLHANREVHKPANLPGS